MCIFRISSAVEQWTVNPLVASSNLASGVYVTEALRVKTLGAFLFFRMDGHVPILSIKLRTDEQFWQSFGL